MPKYRLVQDSYIDNVLYTFNPDPEKDRLNIHDIASHHVPGPHWEPLDDEAKAICKKHGVTFTGFVPDCLDQLTKQLSESMERERLAGNPDAIAAALVRALIEGGVIPKPAAKAAARTSAPAEV